MQKGMVSDLSPLSCTVDTNTSAVQSSVGLGPSFTHPVVFFLFGSVSYMKLHPMATQNQCFCCSPLLAMSLGWTMPASECLGHWWGWQPSSLTAFPGCWAMCCFRGAAKRLLEQVALK